MRNTCPKIAPGAELWPNFGRIRRTSAKIAPTEVVRISADVGQSGPNSAKLGPRWPRLCGCRPTVTGLYKTDCIAKIDPCFALRNTVQVFDLRCAPDDPTKLRPLWANFTPSPLRKPCLVGDLATTAHAPAVSPPRPRKVAVRSPRRSCSTTSRSGAAGANPKPTSGSASPGAGWRQPNTSHFSFFLTAC